MAHGKALELREIQPKRFIAAKRGEFRITPDGKVYFDQGRGWRFVRRAT
jgi:hypothetical protein